MKTELLTQWMNTTKTYGASYDLRLRTFNNLQTRYNESGRRYHNLTHIENMLHELACYYGKTIPDALLFAVWFHDAVYNALLSNNEVKSAALAAKNLKKLHVPEAIMNEVKSLILKTANHLQAEAADETTKVFLDIDLKILGADAITYYQYTKAVRKEYSMFPDVMFNHGRKKFIEKALACDRIFKSEKFYNACEQQARQNLLTELNQLL